MWQSGGRSDANGDKVSVDGLLDRTGIYEPGKIRGRNSYLCHCSPFSHAEIEAPYVTAVGWQPIPLICCISRRACTSSHRRSNRCVEDHRIGLRETKVQTRSIAKADRGGGDKGSIGARALAAVLHEACAQIHLRRCATHLTPLRAISCNSCNPSSHWPLRVPLIATQ